MWGRPGQFGLTTVEVKIYLMLPNDKNQWMESNLQVLVSWFNMSLREANQYVWEFFIPDSVWTTKVDFLEQGWYIDFYCVSHQFPFSINFSNLFEP